MKCVCRATCGVALFVVLALVVGGKTANAAPGDTTRVSVDSNGQQANGFSSGNSISSDGRYVAFHSGASNLVAADTNGMSDVFVHDRQTGITTRVSVTSGGGQSNGISYSPSISGDGRYVAFASEASNLVPGDANGMQDVFVHDRQTGSTTLVTGAYGGGFANGDSFSPSISADGRYVAFDSEARNLIASDTNGVADVFVHDRQTGGTTRVSIATGGAAANGVSDDPSISADGRYVAFESSASNLVPGDTNGTYDIFVHDRQTGSTTLVSVALGGGAANGGSGAASISADGRYVAFDSGASNLVQGGESGWGDVFVYDRQTGATTLVSGAPGGMPSNGGTDSKHAISADGRYVAFRSDASNLVLGDTNGTYDIFVHDRQSGSTRIVSVATGGGVANDSSTFPSISGDGQFVAFRGDASNLVAGDTNGAEDVFVHELGNGVGNGLSLTLSRSLVAGCKNVSGKVILSSPAPAGGLLVSVSDTLAAATVPATVKVAEGATIKSFSVKTVPVATNQSGTVTVSLGGASASQPLTVRPMGMASLVLRPTTVAGSQPSAGTVKLECKAGPGPVTVDLASTNPSVAYPVAASIVVSEGLQTQPFTVATNTVLAKAYATIVATANGVSKSKKLTVTPAAAVAPTRLQFGTQAIGTTSAAMTATLTNKGAVPFSVDSIGLTGTYAYWYSQTNNCPASLSPGSSCTISVRFSPILALTKSARLEIATSATSTPLRVSLSGTGI